MSFTPEERRLLELSDQVEDYETPAEKNVRQSAESHLRQRQRMGDVAYRELRAAQVRRWRERRAERRSA